MLKKILFPIDGSENTKKALNTLLELCEKFESEVILLHTYVLPSEIISILGATDPDINKVEEKIKLACKSLVDKYYDLISSKGIKVKTDVISGDIGYDIVAIAKANSCDLILISSKGHSTFSDLLFGSVSNYVIHHAHCPVLVIY